MKCPYPKTIKNETIGFIQVPCGKCQICQRNLVHDWAVRLRYEAYSSKSVYWVRLSYDHEHLPINESGFVTLCKADLQKFFKRLRKKIKFRYFAVGEYGGKNGRPHYHILFFFDYKIDWHTIRNYIYDSWYKQNIRVQSAYGDMARLSVYCGKYCFKNDNRKDDSQQKPYRTCSKKPILGYAYINKFGSLHITDKRYRFLSAESTLNKPSRLPLAFQRYLFKNESKAIKMARLLQLKFNSKDYETENYIRMGETRIRDNLSSIKAHLQGRRARYEQIEREREQERLNNKDYDL